MNFLKLEIYFNQKVKVQLKISIQVFWRIEEQTESLQHLEVLITGRRLRRIKYSEIKNSIHERLEGWQSRSLSMMSRVTLVRLCSA